MAPPVNPYGVRRATLRCAGNSVGLPVGVAVRVGRDPARVSLLVDDPQVSGLHASVRFDGQRAFLRDERSSLGVTVNGARMVPEQWQELPPGAQISLGPVPLLVDVE